MLYTPRTRDCSVPYKKFYELKNGDKIYNIDYKTLDIGLMTVDNVKVKDIDKYERRNCKEVGQALFSLSTMHDEYFTNAIETDWITGEILKL